MTEIIIDHINTSFLIKRLKELFNPYIITEGNETVLNFNNTIGEGQFTIMTIDEDKLNIYFKGHLNKDTSIAFYNSKQSAINFFYLQQGHIVVSHNEEANKIEKNNIQQLIYSSDNNDVETITLPANTYVEFNFLKLFNVSYLNSKSDAINIETVLKNENKSTYIKAFKANLIDDNQPLLHSSKVADNRIKELEQHIRNLFNIQKNEISKYA